MANEEKKKKVPARKPSAVKRARQSKKRHARNSALTRFLRNKIKSLRANLAAKNKPEAEKQLKPTLATIAKMVRKGILHRNAAARYQSRLMQQFNQL